MGKESCDTNVLAYAFNKDCPEHLVAKVYLESVASNYNFVICELVLTELYVLLRSPRVFSNPLSAKEAAHICQSLRKNPAWQLIDYSPGIMDEIWDLAEKSSFAARQIFDARLALTLKRNGVDIFVTRNTKHFKSFGFDKLINPID